MINEEMLRCAAGEISEAMVESVVLREHEFSPAFIRKLRALTARAEHPLRYRALRQAAAVVAAAIMAFSLLYTTNPTVQAAVNSWIRSTFGSYFQYSPVETTPPDVQYDYALPEEFDGYTRIAEIEREYGKYFIYTNAEGKMLQFEYIGGNGGASIFLDIDDCIEERGTVGNCPADLYLSPTPDENSIIVWSDEDTNTIFYISAVEEKETLIAFAEKVEKISKK